MSERWLSDSESKSAVPTTAEQETITVLGEEIARLEDEIRIRDLAATAEGQDLDANQGQPAHRPCGGRADRPARERARDPRGDDRAAPGADTPRRRGRGGQSRRVGATPQLGPGGRAPRRRSDRPGDGTPRTARGRARGTASHFARRPRRSSDRGRSSARRSVAEVERLRAKFTEVAGESDTSVAAAPGPRAREPAAPRGL